MLLWLARRDPIEVLSNLMTAFVLALLLIGAKDDLWGLCSDLSMRVAAITRPKA